MKNPSKIGNKVKRTEIYAKYKQQKKTMKKKLRAERVREVEALGEKAPPKQIPRTLENSKEIDETIVKPDDEEVFGDEHDDEFAKYYSNEQKPKMMITTRPKCSRKLYDLIGDLMQMLPNSFYYPRGNFTVEQMVTFATNKKFTHLIILSEKAKVCNGLLVTHLPIGPTAFFRQPQFEGRQVVTFHNQRDFIFVRHHRYIYRKEQDKTRARLQELGPRFTLKLKWLQQGTFDTKFGEYEWIHKRKLTDPQKHKNFLS